LTAAGEACHPVGEVGHRDRGIDAISFHPSLRELVDALGRLQPGQPGQRLDQPVESLRFVINEARAQRDQAARRWRRAGRLDIHAEQQFVGWHAAAILPYSRPRLLEVLSTSAYPQFSTTSWISHPKRRKIAKSCGWKCLCPLVGRPYLLVSPNGPRKTGTETGVLALQ